MRILLTSNYFPEHPGGIEAVAEQQARGYRALGHDVRWVAADCGTEPHRAPGDVALRAWNVTERRLGFPYPLPDPRSLARLGALARWADAVHVNDCLYAVSVAAGVHAIRHRRPLLLTQHVPPVPYPNPVLRATQAAAYRLLGTRLLGAADQVAFVSEPVLAAHAGTRLRRPPVVVENGIDEHLFTPLAEPARRRARARLGAGGDRPLVLFVGRMVAKKGAGLVLAAARLAPGLDWVLVGAPGDADLSGRPANARVRGPMAKPDLRDAYAAADLLVLPSTGEGFPVAVQESMATGTPALVRGTTATALPGLEGLLFSVPQDVTAGELARAVEQAVGAAGRLRARVAAIARDRWAAATMARRYSSILSQLAGA